MGLLIIVMLEVPCLRLNKKFDKECYERYCSKLLVNVHVTDVRE